MREGARTHTLRVKPKHENGWVKQAMAYCFGTLMALLIFGVLAAGVIAFALHRIDTSEAGSIATGGETSGELSAQDLQTLDSVDADDGCMNGYCVTAWEGQQTCGDGLSCDFRFSGTKPADEVGPVISANSPLKFEDYEISGDEIGSTEFVIEGSYTCFGGYDLRSFGFHIGSSGDDLEDGDDLAKGWATECVAY